MTLENGAAFAKPRFKPDETLDFSLSDSRQNIYFQASTSPHRHAEFIESMFDAAIYPKESVKSGLIERLNQNFVEEWYELNQKWGSPERSQSALSSLYFFTRDYIAPIRQLFTIESLVDANKTNSTVHYMARDAYVEFLIATQLKHQHIIKETPVFNYVPLSVRLMRQINDPEKKPILDKYLRQFSFGDGKRHEIVDIGFTGEIPHLLSRAFPKDQYDIHFLINEADEAVVQNRPVMASAKGFIYDADKPDKFGLFDSQIRRTLKRVMEDTFSGLSTSSTDISVNQDTIRTNSKPYQENYDSMRRKLALRAIRDGLKIWQPSLSDLDTLTSERTRVKLVSNFKQLILYYENFLDSDQIFVPHEPTNLNLVV